MNNLEKEILKAINPHFEDGDGDKLVQAAASVCLKWMRDSFNAGGARIHPGLDVYETFDDYLKANGLTPTEPDTKEAGNEWAEWNAKQFTQTASPVIGSNGIINGDYKEDPGK